MANIGPPEIMLIVLAVLLIFGGSQIPKLARSLGQAQKEFKDGLRDGSQEEPSKKEG